MSRQRAFARIVTARSGHQVLFYVSPAGTRYVLHQVCCSDDMEADLRIAFRTVDKEANQRHAYVALDMADQEQADRVVAAMSTTPSGGDRTATKAEEDILRRQRSVDVLNRASRILNAQAEVLHRSHKQSSACWDSLSAEMAFKEHIDTAAALSGMAIEIARGLL
jgi:hypothetical protein